MNRYDLRFSTIHLRSHVVTLMVLAFVVAGCSGWKVRTESSDQLPRYTVRSMALVPFTAIVTPQVRDQGNLHFATPQGIRQSEMSLAIPSEVEPPSRQAVSLPGHAAERITQLFWKQLQERDGLQIVPLGDSAKAAAAEGILLAAKPEAAAASLAKKLKADAALIGYVSMYQERVGSRLGANPAASVGFEVKVVAVDGRVLWIGHYYERQRPLTEDFVGFVKRYGMFVTAEELAEYGVEEILKEFPFGAGREK
ncbi:MAG: hypothetical protein HP498_13210 [Nitrospira sp.]|nr:hypothetical protein [Nitrospira sp.]